MSPLVRMLAYCSIAVWPATVLRFIHRHAPNIPYWDEWDAVPTFVALHRGTLTFGDLWAAHNEHRIFSSWIVMLLLDRFGGWDLAREMNLSVVVATMSVILLTLLVRRTGARYAWPFAGLIFSTVSFSFVQSENWSWGGTLSTFLVNISVVAVIFLLSLDRRRRWENLLLAIFCGFFGSFALGQGLMIWIAGLAVLLCTPRFAWKRLVAWCSAAVAAFTLYLHGLNQIAGHSLLSQLLTHPIDGAKYIFVYLGAPLGRWLGLSASIAIGILELTVFATLAVAAIYHGKQDVRTLLRSSGWIGLGIFPIANSIVTALGREDLGLPQAEASRYTTTTMLLVIAIIGLVTTRLRYRAILLKVMAPAISGLAAIFVLNLGCSESAHREAVASLNLRILAVKAIGKTDSASDALIAAYLYPHPAVLRVNLATLERIGEARSFAL